MTLPWAWPGPPDEVWQQMKAVAVPFRPLLDRVPAERWPEIDAEVSREVARYFEGEKISFGAEVIRASGRK